MFYYYVVELDGIDVKILFDIVKGVYVGGVNIGNIGVCYVGGVDKKMNFKDMWML